MGLQSPTHITLQKVEVLPNLLEFGPKVILVGTNNLLITPIPKIVNNRILHKYGTTQVITNSNAAPGRFYIK